MIEIDAQAAALARVRALADNSRHPRHGAGGCGVYAAELYEALSGSPAAPEATNAPSCHEEWAEGSKEHVASLTSDLAAANARIAELEGRLEKEQERATSNADMYAAANARADAAERLVPPKVAAHFDHVYQRAERAESEAAALRAEVEPVTALGDVAHETAPGNVLEDK